jgi:hypothetical protein
VAIGQQGVTIIGQPTNGQSVPTPTGRSNPR